MKNLKYLIVALIVLGLAVVACEGDKPAKEEDVTITKTKIDIPTRYSGTLPLYKGEMGIFKVIVSNLPEQFHTKGGENAVIGGFPVGGWAGWNVKGAEKDVAPVQGNFSDDGKTFTGIFNDIGWEQYWDDDAKASKPKTSNITETQFVGGASFILWNTKKWGKRPSVCPNPIEPFSWNNDWNTLKKSWRNAPPFAPDTTWKFQDAEGEATDIIFAVPATGRNEIYNLVCDASAAGGWAWKFEKITAAEEPLTGYSVTTGLTDKTKVGAERVWDPPADPTTTTGGGVEPDPTTTTGGEPEPDPTTTTEEGTAS